MGHAFIRLQPEQTVQCSHSQRACFCWVAVPVHESSVGYTNDDCAVMRGYLQLQVLQQHSSCTYVLLCITERDARSGGSRWRRASKSDVNEHAERQRSQSQWSALGKEYNASGIIHIH